MCALCLNPTVDSDLGGAVGWAGRGTVSWSSSTMWAPGQKQTRSICLVERDVIPGFCREQIQQCQVGHAGMWEGASNARWGCQWLQAGEPQGRPGVTWGWAGVCILGRRMGLGSSLGGLHSWAQPPSQAGGTGGIRSQRAWQCGAVHLWHLKGGLKWVGRNC